LKEIASGSELNANKGIQSGKRRPYGAMPLSVVLPGEANGSIFIEKNVTV